MEENEAASCEESECGGNSLVLSSTRKSEKSRATSRNSERTNDSGSLIEAFKGIIQERHKRQILILCTDLKDKHFSKHVIDSAVALRNHGHNITMITTAFDVNRFSENLAKIAIIQVGRWIPDSIKGYFSDIFYFIRSLYSTIFMIRNYRRCQPRISVVLCETNCFMIPIIKYFTKYKVIYFQYVFQLAQHRLPASELCLHGSFLRKYCLKKADRILVPNHVFCNIFKRSFSNQIIPYVCEPYLNIRSLRNEVVLPINHVVEGIYKDTMIFLVLAEYHPRSNMELALDAFHLLLHSSDHALHSRLRLVVAGNAGPGYSNYMRHLATRVRRLQLENKVLLHSKPSRLHKKALIAGCLAMVNCCEQGLWDRYVLEAMALGRPVIATNSGFTADTLEHGVTGYVVPATPDCFAAAMSEIIYNASKGEFIGKMAHCEFIKKYSLEAYGLRLNKIINQIFLYDKYPLHNFHNGELFFG